VKIKASALPTTIFGCPGRKNPSQNPVIDRRRKVIVRERRVFCFHEQEKRIQGGRKGATEKLLGKVLNKPWIIKDGVFTGKQGGADKKDLKSEKGIS